MTEIKQLIVSVDTEEEGLWGGSYPVRGNTTENLRGLPRFQATCEQLSVPPTYLIDAPVLDDAEAIGYLRRWQDAGRCEVGSHCHPWCNPPLSAAAPTSAETYLCNYPLEVQYQKLQWLTERIGEALGRAPTSYRAGRYGFDASTATVLRDLGYRVDSSVLPLHDYRRLGGPDFRYARRDPYRLPGESSGDSNGEFNGGELIEVPVTAGFTRPGYAWRRKVWTGLRSKPWHRLRVAGLADQVGTARRVKLTPEGTRLSDVCHLIDACVADGLSTLVLMLHSSSLRAGLSPYAPSETDLDVFYGRFTEMIRHAVSKHDFVPVTLNTCGARLSQLVG